MPKLYDFRCPECDTIEEHLQWNDEDVHCSTCGVEAIRLVPAPRLDYKSFWAAGMESGDRWTKVRKQHMAAEKRAMEKHGTYSVGGQSNSWDSEPVITNRNGERLKKVR